MGTQISFYTYWNSIPWKSALCLIQCAHLFEWTSFNLSLIYFTQCDFFFLSIFKEDNNTRVLFERVLTSGSLPPEKSGYVLKSSCTALEKIQYITSFNHKYPKEIRNMDSRTKLGTDVPSPLHVVQNTTSCDRFGKVPIPLLVKFINLLASKPHWCRIVEDRMQNPPVQ